MKGKKTLGIRVRVEHHPRSSTSVGGAETIDLRIFAPDGYEAGLIRLKAGPTGGKGPLAIWVFDVDPRSVQCSDVRGDKVLFARLRSPSFVATAKACPPGKGT